MATRSFRSLNTQTINDENLGVSATLGIERTEQSRMLPVSPLISMDGKELSLVSGNSVMLTAGFVLNLSAEMPLEMQKYREIVTVTGIEFVDGSVKAPLLQLITKSTSDDVLESGNSRGLFVVSLILVCGIAIMRKLRRSP